MEKHYTLLKSAELLGVTTQTLRNWDKAGKIRTIRTPGNQRRIPESEIVRLLNYASEETVTPKQEPQRIIADNDTDNQIVHESVESTANENIVEENAETLAPLILKNKDAYLLMCKDEAVYDITQDIVLNEGLLPGCLLKETMNYEQWMETRYCRDSNFSAQRLLYQAFGSYDLEHAKQATGALSLSDCYWIKKYDEEIMFDDVTPYIHKEWDGLSADGVQNDYIWGSLSNLFVSGKTDKRWLDAQTLLKVDTFAEYEPYKLCLILGLENTAEAYLTNEGLILNNFTSPDYFYESMEQFGIEDDDIDPRDIFIEKYGETAAALFVVDYLVENNDRHTDDFGFLRSSSTGDYTSMAPYYNFDWVWSGTATPLPEAAWHGYRGYIHAICRNAIKAARDFEYGTIIERRATELLRG